MKPLRMAGAKISCSGWESSSCDHFSRYCAADSGRRSAVADDTRSP